MWHSGKGKITEMTKKNQQLPGVGVGVGWEGMKKWSTDFQDSENILCDTILVDTCHHTFVLSQRMYHTKVNPNVNCGLGVIMMCQCRSINRNKWITLGDVGNGGGCAWVGTGDSWEISVSSSSFCHKPKTALKKCYFLKRKWNKHLVKGESQHLFRKTKGSMDWKFIMGHEDKDLCLKKNQIEWYLHFFFLKIISAILVPLLFHINLRITHPWIWQLSFHRHSMGASGPGSDNFPQELHGAQSWRWVVQIWPWGLSTHAEIPVPPGRCATPGAELTQARGSEWMNLLSVAWQALSCLTRTLGASQRYQAQGSRLVSGLCSSQAASSKGLFLEALPLGDVTQGCLEEPPAFPPLQKWQHPSL